MAKKEEKKLTPEELKQVELIRLAMKPELEAMKEAAAITRRDVFTIEQAALVMGTSPAEIKALVKNKKLTYTYLGNKKRIARSVINSFINQNQFPV